MTVKNTKKPAAKKPAAKEEANQTPAVEDVMVKPLDSQALKMVMSIIDKADVKGGDAGPILMLKQELARAAGVKTQ